MINPILSRLTPAHRDDADRTGLTRTFADALAMDLAIAPMIVATAPGFGASTQLHALAEAHGMEHVEYRLDMMDQSDLEPLPVLRDGVVQPARPMPRGLDEMLGRGRPTLDIVDFEQDDARVETFLRIVASADIHQDVVVALRTRTGRTAKGRDLVDVAYAAIKAAFGVERPLVPTSIVGDASNSHARRVLLIGCITGSSSNIGELHCEMECIEPYPHEVRLTIEADEGQSDDQFHDALGDACSARTVAVLASLDDGYLTCSPGDIVVLEARG